MYKPHKNLKGRSTISSFPTYAISISSKTKENIPTVLSYLKEFVIESKFETGIIYFNHIFYSSSKSVR